MNKTKLQLTISIWVPGSKLNELMCELFKLDDERWPDYHHSFIDFSNVPTSFRNVCVNIPVDSYLALNERHKSLKSDDGKA